MKKIIGIVLPLFLFSLPILPVLGTYGVSIGETFVYDCIAAERTIALGPYSGEAEGYQIDGQHFDPGTSVTVEITNFISDSVVYSVSSGGYVYNALSDLPAFIDGLRFKYIIYPFHFTVGLANINDWNQTKAEEDPALLLDEPFIDIEAATWSDLKDCADYLVSEYSTLSAAEELILSADYFEDETTFICEFYLHG
ncbi:MAG: choice-of-anchor S family protein, partial [Promethearchaeota archaeon]